MNINTILLVFIKIELITYSLIVLIIPQTGNIRKTTTLLFVLKQWKGFHISIASIDLAKVRDLVIIRDHWYIHTFSETMANFSEI